MPILNAPKHVMRLVIATLTQLTAAPVLAQDASPLPPGAEVRVRSPVASGRFVVHDHRAATLMLRDSAGTVVSVPVASVTKLAVLRGRRTAGASALRGAGIGGLAGAATGIVFGLVTASEPMPPVGLALVMGSLLGGTGAAAGAVIGAVFPGERWETVPLDAIQAGPSNDGGMALGLAIRF